MPTLPREAVREQNHVVVESSPGPMDGSDSEAESRWGWDRIPPSDLRGFLSRPADESQATSAEGTDGRKWRRRVWQDAEGDRHGYAWRVEG